MKINFQLAHKISVVQILLRHDERLLEFFFSHKQPELRDSPDALIEQAKGFSRGEQLLIRAALDAWSGDGGTKLADLLDYWDHENWAAFIQAMVMLHELDWSDGEFL